jgi:hypothetical protein
MTPDPLLQSDLLSYLGQLGPEDQARVVDFARTLVVIPEQAIQGVPGNRLLDLAGCIGHDDADQMIKAIEEGCERIDANNW